MGSGIAEILALPSITVARKIEVSNANVKVERVVSDGYETIEAPMPALITASSEIGELRSATVKEIIAAQKKPITVWNAKELGVDASQMRQAKPLRLFTPQKENRCEVVEGETAEEMGANLAVKLRAAQIL